MGVRDDEPGSGLLSVRGWADAQRRPAGSWKVTKGERRDKVSQSQQIFFFQIKKHDYKILKVSRVFLLYINPEFLTQASAVYYLAAILQPPLGSVCESLVF